MPRSRPLISCPMVAGLARASDVAILKWPTVVRVLLPNLLTPEYSLSVSAVSKQDTTGFSPFPV